MNPIKVFHTPEYLFRPSQILTRLKRSVFKPQTEIEKVTLPWGASIHIRPLEVIGSSIWYYGVFDLIVTEAIARLLEPGDTCLDIGANIGQMTSLMGFLTGPTGKVHAFEPHPEVFRDLTGNVESWSNQKRYGQMICHETALSDRSGEDSLVIRAGWNDNRGIGSIRREDPPSQGQRIRIKVSVLDQLLADAGPIGLCKIDVEGHEEQVFKGAERTLGQGRIRDIIFEDLIPHPSPLERLLVHHGYTIFSLRSKPMRPVLSPSGGATNGMRVADGLNYLATRQPDRAMGRFQHWGWRVLRLS